MKEISDIIFNIRKWDTTGIENVEDFYIAENLQHSTVIVDPELYERLKHVKYNGKEVYVLKARL